MFPDPTAAPNNAPAPGIARLVAGHDGNTLRPFLVDTTGRARVVIDQVGPIAISNFPAVQAVSGSVAVTNLPATQPISGTVAVANLPAVQHVAVDNLPATQPVSGTVSVGNLPATQAVSGTVGVSNFPATQAVAGTVAVSNLPATQPVSGSVSVANLPAVQHVSVDNLPATQPVSGTVSVANLPATQPVSGSVSVSNLPATQPVSGTVAVSNFPASQAVVVSGTASVTVGNFPATQPTRTEAADRARAGAMFSAATPPANPSNAAPTVLAVFANPAGSGKTCYLDAWAVATGTAAFVQVTTGPTITSAGTATTATRRNPGVAATPVGSLSAGPTLSANGTTERSGWTSAGSAMGEETRGSWVVPPGSSIAWIAQNATLVAGLFGQASVRVQWWEG